MNSEKVKEIKKALDYCSNHNVLDCSNVCPYDKYNSGCRTELAKDCLTLINTLEKCSEKWQKHCADEVALNKPLNERIKELESENKTLLKSKTMWKRLHTELCKENQQLKDRIAELEEGIAKSMLGCEFLPECTKEIAEKIWNMAKITVDATKHIVQGKEYLHLDALKEIVKSCGVEIKE